MWLIGAMSNNNSMVCLLATPWVQLSVSAGNGRPHNALRHHWLMPISCHFRDCKALLVTSLTHVSGAITSVQTPDLYLLSFTFKCPVHLVQTLALLDAELKHRSTATATGAVHNRERSFLPTAPGQDVLCNTSVT